MRINPIQTVNNNSNSLSFGNVVIEQKSYCINNIKDIEKLKKYIEHSGRLENLKINLREMVKSWKLTQGMKYVLKNYLDVLGKDETENLTVKLEHNCYGPSMCDISFPKPADSSSNGYRVYFNAPMLNPYNYCNYDWNFAKILLKRKRWDFINFRMEHGGYPALVREHQDDVTDRRRIPGKVYSYEGFILPNEKAVLKAVEKVLYRDISRMAETIDEEVAREKKKDKLDRDKEKYLREIHYKEIPPERMFPGTSISCTVDDILKYLEKPLTYDWYRACNEPVTIDGESLLIALARIKPNAENYEKYAKILGMLEVCRKCNTLDFNQKDSLGVPFIDHVLNSENEPLLLFASQANDLKYEPALEKTFDNIRNPEFKKLVLKLNLFDNIYNLKYKTIFGQPNPNLE